MSFSDFHLSTVPPLPEPTAPAPSSHGQTAPSRSSSIPALLPYDAATSLLDTARIVEPAVAALGESPLARMRPRGGELEFEIAMDGRAVLTRAQRTSSSTTNPFVPQGESTTRFSSRLAGTFDSIEAVRSPSKAAEEGPAIQRSTSVSSTFSIPKSPVELGGGLDAMTTPTRPSPFRTRSYSSAFGIDGRPTVAPVDSLVSLSTSPFKLSPARSGDSGQAEDFPSDYSTSGGTGGVRPSSASNDDFDVLKKYTNLVFSPSPQRKKQRTREGRSRGETGFADRAAPGEALRRVLQDEATEGVGGSLERQATLVDVGPAASLASSTDGSSSQTFARSSSTSSASPPSTAQSSLVFDKPHTVVRPSSPPAGAVESSREFEREEETFRRPNLPRSATAPSLRTIPSRALSVRQHGQHHAPVPISNPTESSPSPLLASLSDLLSAPSRADLPRGLVEVLNACVEEATRARDEARESAGRDAARDVGSTVSELAKRLGFVQVVEGTKASRGIVGMSLEVEELVEASTGRMDEGGGGVPVRLQDGLDPVRSSPQLLRPRSTRLAAQLHHRASTSLGEPSPSSAASSAPRQSRSVPECRPRAPSPPAPPKCHPPYTHPIRFVYEDGLETYEEGRERRNAGGAREGESEEEEREAQSRRSTRRVSARGKVKASGRGRERADPIGAEDENEDDQDAQGSDEEFVLPRRRSTRARGKGRRK
ncbi:hypothetical protein JCM10212_001076 [Sporobolomyces blumeae]